MTRAHAHMHHASQALVHAHMWHAVEAPWERYLVCFYHCRFHFLLSTSRELATRKMRLSRFVENGHHERTDAGTQAPSRTFERYRHSIRVSIYVGNSM